MSIKRFLIAAVLLSFLLPAVSHAAGRIEFILDMSGSMNAMTGGEKKIDIAKNALSTVAREIPDGTLAALRIYGHRVPKEKKAESCLDSQLVIPFGPIDKQAFIAALNQATPLGQTPLAYSLEQAAKDFGPAKDEVTAIILVSDGEETCGGDPVAVAKNLLAQGFKITIHTVGFNVDAATRAQLEAISKATGGQYRDARDAKGLADSLAKLTQESLVIEKKEAVYGDPIRGGDSYETAVALTPGKLYHLDHHQKKAQYDYFYTDLKAGQSLTATIQTGDKGVDIAGDTAKENLVPYAGIEIDNSSHERLASQVIIGSRNNQKEATINVGSGQDGRYFILVGNSYDAQHMNNPFKVDVTSRFDAGTERDAGETEELSIPVSTGETKGYLGPGDRMDMYKFSATAGSRFTVKARPASDKVALKLVALDADGVQLAGANAPNAGAAVTLENIAMPQDGVVFLKLGSFYSDVPLTDYALDIATTAETSAAEEVPPEALPVQTAAQPVTAMPVAADEPAAQSSMGISVAIQTLPFWDRIKFYLMYSVAPLAAGALIGFIWGYIKGRRARKG
jgi:hypothetical protein